MSISRIKALVLQELYITRHSLEVIVDLFYFSIVTIIVWGLISNYLSGSLNSQSAHYLLIGMILWEIIRVIQYSISVGALWNIWSRNLSNMFISPLSLTEYIVASLISAISKSLVILIIISIIASFVFRFNILDLGFLNFIMYFINLAAFAWSVGIVVLGFIFRYGTRIQALAWGIVFIFQPLSASFFPVKILPEFLQKVAFLIPATHIFEAARFNLANPATNWTEINIAIIENVIYAIIGIWFFNKMFNKSKETGQFARNEG